MKANWNSISIVYCRFPVSEVEKSASHFSADSVHKRRQPLAFIASESEMPSFQQLTKDQMTVASCLAVFGIERMVTADEPVIRAEWKKRVAGDSG
jgi:hypothetical protein